MNSLFSGKKFYIIHSNDPDIKTLLYDNGALLQSYLSETISFAISDNANSSEVGEAEDIYHVSVVTSEWIKLCLEWGKCQFAKAFNPAIRKLFSDKVFFITNINPEDKDKLQGYVRVFGGSVVNSIAEETITHLVLGTIEGEKHKSLMEQLLDSQVVIVTPDWIVDCTNHRSLLDAALYHPDVLYDRLKKLHISNENEKSKKIQQNQNSNNNNNNNSSSNNNNSSGNAQEQLVRRQVSETPSIAAPQQFTLSGLHQAVPVSIQDSLLTRQLPASLGRSEQQPYFVCRSVSSTKTVTTMSTVGNSVSQPTLTGSSSSTKTKSGKSNKHINEQTLNESEKEAIVMQNVMSILGQSHSNKKPQLGGVAGGTGSGIPVSEKAPQSTNIVKKPRSPRSKSGSNKCLSTNNQQQINVAAGLSAAKSVIPSSSSLSSSSQMLTSSSIIQLNSVAQTNNAAISNSLVSTAVIGDIKTEPSSPIAKQMLSNQQQQVLTNVPRYNMVCVSQSNIRHPEIMDTVDSTKSIGISPQQAQIKGSIGGSGNVGGIVASVPPGQSMPNIILQQQAPPPQHQIQQQIQSRQLHRQLQQQQQQSSQQQQSQQQPPQQQQKLITLGQIQAAAQSHQVPQWQSAIHMSPTQQHTSPTGTTIVSPGGLCATVTSGVPQSPSGAQMYQIQQPAIGQLTPQQALRGNILSNGNQMMLNNGLPINAQCASMVTNVAGPIHLQSSIAGGNPATLMLHQQQLQVAGNLTPTAMHCQQNPIPNASINMNSGKILSGPNVRMQHSQISPGVRVANASYSLVPNASPTIPPNTSNGDHTHHPSSGHLSRPFPGLLRLPQYVGHEGIVNGICRDNCLIGCVFYFYGYEDVNQMKRDNWLSAIRCHGGETVSSYSSDRVTHIIVDCQLEDPDLFKLALKNKTRVVTIYWVNDVIEKGHLEPPFDIIHLPSPFSKNLTFSYIRKQIVSITGFEGEERKKVEYMVIQLGVKYTEYLEASNTVLICKKPSGRKYDAAQKLSIACVNVRWLQDIYFGDLQTLSAEVDHKYQCFELSDVSIRLEKMTHRVQELMIGWIIPIRLDENSWKKYQILKQQYEAEKLSRKRQAEIQNSIMQAKKLKWSLPNLSDDEIHLAQSCNAKVNKLPVKIKFENGEYDGDDNSLIKRESTDKVEDFLQPIESQPRIIVAFTGLLPEQRDKLTDIVVSLGGSVSEDMNECTHLVARNIIRTPKFYYGILRGCHIVTVKWLQACAFRQMFIDEEYWKLEDKDGERQFGFSLDVSLRRARNRMLRHSPPLFDGIEFFLSPRAKHRQVCIDLIRACGGTIREKRPIQKMALMPEPRHLIICHEDDSHLANYLTRTKTGNKAVHHEEFVLSGVMRQELDFDSYQIQYVTIFKNAFSNHTFVPNAAENCGNNCSTDLLPVDQENVPLPTAIESSSNPMEPQHHQQQHQATDENPIYIKSEPVSDLSSKFLKANIFSQFTFPMCQPESSMDAVVNPVVNTTTPISFQSSVVDSPSVSQSNHIETSMLSIKTENRSPVQFLSPAIFNKSDSMTLCKTMNFAEMKMVNIKDQILGISSPSQLSSNVSVNELPSHETAVTSSLIPVSMNSVPFSITAPITQIHSTKTDINFEQNHHE